MNRTAIGRATLGPRLLVMCAAVLALACTSSPDNVQALRERRTQEILRQAEESAQLAAFGGHAIAIDEGEFGGRLMFREADGESYTLVDDNALAIHAMPYGVIALTGLAHKTLNRGAVHRLDREPGGRVAASHMLDLPGAPCDQLREGDRITMRIHAGFSRHNDRVEPIMTCWVLMPDLGVRQYPCPPEVSDLCVR